jgi:hypothetical protein
VLEDGAELAREALLLLRSEGEVCEARDATHFVEGNRHDDRIHDRSL